jgi:hypothetical protein
MRGRLRTLHNPVRISFWTEKADKDAADATNLTYAVLFHQGIKTCLVTGRGRPEVLGKLAEAEVQMAEDHEDQAAMHRHRAEEILAHIKQRTLGGPDDAQV